MNSLKNYEFSYFEIRMSYLMSLSFGYYKPKKSVEKYLDVYEQIEEENSLAQYLKTENRGINISYAALYVYKENNIAKQC